MSLLRTSPANRPGARIRAMSMVAISAVALSLLGTVAPASAVPLDVPANPADWAATPYSPLTWPEVPAAGNTANLTFNAEAGGLPDAAGIGTGFTMVQPSSAATSSPYYVPSNLSVADGKLTILTTKGIANLAINDQDNTLGFGVDAHDKALRLTTTLTSPSALNGFAQGGLWFGADDENFIKLALIGNNSTGRQIQLAKEIAGAVVPANDQRTVTTSQGTLGTKPVTLDLLVDGVNKSVTGSYTVGTDAPLSVGTLTGVPDSFFDGSALVSSAEKPESVTSFAGLFATKRNIAEGTALSFSFDNFGFAEVDVTSPTTPTGLVATGGSSSIDLAWQASVDSDLAGYRVYRSASSPVATTGTPISGADVISATTFSDTTTFAGANYHYAVVAVDAVGITSPAVEAGPAQSSAPLGDVVAKVDFTTAAANAAAGYSKDDGSAYDTARGFGWENVAGAPTSITTETRVRSTAGVDAKLDSIIHLQYKASAAGSIAAESVWQYDVPNGTYAVVAAAGDSGGGITNGYDSQHTIRAEGVSVLDRFQAAAGRQYDEATAAGIVVSDGRLTIDAIGGTNSKLSYLEIYRTALTPVEPVEPVAPAAPAGLTSTIDGTDVTVNWTAADGVVSYKVFRGASADVDVTAAPLGTVETPTFVDLTAEAGNTYYYVVVATSADALDSAASASVEAVLDAAEEPELPPVEEPGEPAACQSAEWSVDYFSGRSLAGAPVASECVVDIDQTTAPEGVGEQQYSARFVKVIDEGAGTYKFTALSDDGVRVFVDGVAVIDEWRDQAATAPYEGSVTLTEGQHVVMVEYYQGWGGAKLKVDYYKPFSGCTASEWSVDYFSGTSLAGAPVASECVVDIDQTSAPESVGTELYSARFNKIIDEGAGTYDFSVFSDDGVRVFVDGEAVIDEWRGQDGATAHTASVTLTEGQHVVSVEYYQGWGDAKLKFEYYKPSSDCVASEWSVDYFSGTSLVGAPVASECVVDIDQTSAPESVGTELYSARFNKIIDEGAGTYDFSVFSDDGVRVFVDGEAVIDEWRGQDGATAHTASVTLTEGQHVVSVEYYQGWGSAKLKFEYYKPSSDCVASEWSVDYFSGTSLAGAPVASECVVDIDQTSAPESVGTELYSARFNKIIDEGAGTYDFSVFSDDGVRVFVDGEAVIDEWYGQDGTNLHTASVTLIDGQHVVSVEYYQGWGGAKLKVDYDKAGADVEAPAAPTELVAAQVEQSIELDWASSSSSDVAGYRVYRGTAAGVVASNEPLSGSTLLTDPSFTDSTVTVGTTYYYVVVAVDIAGNVSVVSNEAMGLVEEAPDTEAPAAPTALVAVGGDESVALTWTASESDDTIGYKIYRGTEANVLTRGELISGAAPLAEVTYTDETAVNGATYFYAVIAVDLAGNESGSSNEAEATAQTSDVTAPTALTATSAASSVTLDWTASTSTGLAGYYVYRGAEPAVSTTGTPISGSAPVAAVTWTDTSVTDGTTYFYVVVAVDRAGNLSPASNEVIAVPRVPNTTNVKVDFTETNGAPVTGYLADWGQAFGVRAGTTQGNGSLSYGWMNSDGNSVSLVSNGRDRGRAGIPALVDSVIHMQYGDANGGTGTNGVKTEGVWELDVPNGLYAIELAVGDEPGAENIYDSNNVINVEGTVGVESFTGTAATEYKTIETKVGVWDGKLTIDATGGTNTKIGYIEVTGLPFTPHVDTVLPENRVTGHNVAAGVSATIKVPYAGIGLDPLTLPGNVHLFDVAANVEVPSTSGSSGGNDVISLAPNVALKPNTAYRFVVTSGVKDNFGVAFAPFESLFTTGSGVVTGSDEFTPAKNIAFEKIELPTGRDKYWASFQFGPDGKLYGSTIGQGIFRFTVNSDGTLGEPEPLGYEGQAIIGLLFDKSSTADDLRVWITSTTANFSEQGQWVSSVHQLSGPNLETDRTIFSSLPRSLSDHLSNSMAYGPDGRIYFMQGANTAAGDLDSAWGQRGEQLLTAAALVFDPADPAVATAANGGGAIDVKTAQGGTYDPYKANAPLKIYATGIRNAYDLVWHSNGHLYVSTNGTAGGANTPGVTANANGTFTRTAAAGIPGFSTVNGKDVTAQCVRRGYTGGTVPPTGNIKTQKDLMFDVVEGGYYGHPNPERCEFVLNAGNDAATPNAPGTSETKYPVGTKADPNYRGVVFDYEFNKSPNGSLEYKSSTFGGQLKGRVITTRFSNNNDLIFMQPDNATGKILGAQLSVGITGVPDTTMSGVDGFNDPLEVVEDTKNGNLYVNQYDRSGSDQRLYLLRVPASQQAANVSSSVNELVFSTVKSTTSAAKTVTVTNNSTKTATLNTSLVGGQAGEFSVTGGNVSVPSKGSITLAVTFKPGTTVGQRSTTLRLTSGESSVDVGIYGLSMQGIEGGNEPTLNNVLGTLGYKVNVGWTNLEGGVEPTAKGDEVLEPLFVKSGTAAPTMTPIAQYAPREDLPFGWYTGDGTETNRHKIGSIDISGYQSLLPPASAGSSSGFDPGAETFGLYYYSNKFGRFGYTEDSLNTQIPHRARIYPAKNRAGTLLPNTYIVAFEDASNGDYQDYLFVVTGIKPVTSTGSLDGAVRVDFTSKIGGLATGYLRDYGQAFSPRTAADQGSGLTFGWKDSTTENDVDLSTGGSSNLGSGRDRASSQTDQRLDSFMHMQTATLPNYNGKAVDAYWEIAVPNGQYDVTVAVGDPAVQSDPEVHQINAEDTELVHLFTPTGATGTATRHQTATKTVTVADGFLTVDARGGTNTKISYIDIVPVVNGGGNTGDDPTDGAQVKVNFQTPTAPTPAGWTADIGAAYSAAAGSGWTDPATGDPVDRTTANRYRTTATAGIAYPSSVLLQTYAFLQTNPGPAVWEYAVPNGTYEVAVSVGDAGYLDSVHRVTAEDQPVIADFTPTGATPFQTGKRTVTVTDGRLTIAGTGENTKIDWVSIKGDGLDGPPVPVVPSLKVNFQPDTVAVPSGWTADTGASFSSERGYGWLVNGQPGDKSNGTRYRDAPTPGFAYPTGDVTRQTFIIAQAGPATGSIDGVWEYALANGTYEVSVSVGDSGYIDSVHGVEVEGTSVLSGFVPTQGAPFKTGTAQVTVTDGVLTLVPTGENTKVDWITITGNNLAAPSVAVAVNGSPVGATFAGGTASVRVDATASGDASIQSLTWALDGGTAVPYTGAIVVDQVGTRVLTITATDSEGRITTRVVTLTIENIGGTLTLRNEQATRVNGAVAPGFSEDWLVMQRINSGVTTHMVVDEATVTVTNKGTKDLRIDSLALGGANASQFQILNAPAGTPKLAPDASIPVTVKFISNTGSRGIRSAQLTIASSDPAQPRTVVQLRGGFMGAPEGGSELTLPEISALYGWTTNIGTLENGDEMRTSAFNGEEVRSLQWKRADSSLPVTARQLAAFHGCCDATETININGATARHAAPYGQSILPPTATGAPTQLSTNPTANFGIIVAGQTTNNTGYMAVKTWPVRDRNGAIVAGAWIIGHDYIGSPNQCGIAPTNCDFQDNVYLITNVLPVASTDVTAPDAPTATSAKVSDDSVTVGWTASAAVDLGGYYVERATSASGPWARVSGGTPVTATAWVDSTLPFAAKAFYRVIGVDASGNISAPSAVAEVDISGLGMEALRINAGGPAVTTASGSWLADTYFTGGKTYSNASVTQIAGTTDDAVYLSERSLAGSFGYDVPLQAGNYTVKLHFAEIYHGATGGGAGGTGKRVFDVNFEGGTKEIVGLDINGKVAPMTAYVTSNVVTVTDGNLDIDFTSTVDQAKISAIEITRSN